MLLPESCPLNCSGFKMAQVQCGRNGMTNESADDERIPRSRDSRCPRQPVVSHVANEPLLLARYQQNRRMRSQGFGQERSEAISEQFGQDCRSPWRSAAAVYPPPRRESAPLKMGFGRALPRGPVSLPASTPSLIRAHMFQVGIGSWRKRQT